MTTPADELRTAAEALRQLTEHTSPAPWWGDDIDEVQSPLGQIARALSGGGKAPYPNSRYIAAMHPGVGAALADWLDFEADLIALVPGAELRGRTERALNVARSINAQS
jgi:hypothetical protein